MKNLIIAIFAIVTLTSLTSCGKDNDPGCEGPISNNNGGGGGVVVTVGGGTGNGGSGINNGAGETLYGYVYDLDVTSDVTVYPKDGGQPYTVPVSTNLRNEMATYLNTCTFQCQKRYWVNVIWVQNGLTFEWFQRAQTGSADPDC